LNVDVIEQFDLSQAFFGARCSEASSAHLFNRQPVSGRKAAAATTRRYINLKTLQASAVAGSKATNARDPVNAHKLASDFFTA